MTGSVKSFWLGGVAALMFAGAAFAQDVPALKGVSAAEKERVTALIEAAKKEGSISYVDAVIQPETNDALTAAFKKRYGLPDSFKVNYTLMSTLGLITKVDQELAAGRVSFDVVAVGSAPWVFEKSQKGQILPYDSPEYANYQVVFDSGLGKKGEFAFNGAYIFVPMWSEDHLKFNGKSYKDVIGAVPEGRMSIGDATKSATYLATYLAQKGKLDTSFFQSLAKMKPALVVRSELIAGRLTSGEDLMAYSGMPTRAYQYNQKGAKLKFMLPTEGVVLLPQGMFINKAAPHPNAAKLWIDFTLSEEGQKIIVQGEALISGRTGLKTSLPEYAPPIESLNVIKADWAAMTTPELQKAREEWGKLFNP
jgi:iron(III) transport system substrate-binding protein